MNAAPLICDAPHSVCVAENKFQLGIEGGDVFSFIMHDSQTGQITAE